MSHSDGPGTILAQAFHDHGIASLESCGCASLAREMDQAGYEGVRRQLAWWTGRAVETSAKWIRLKTGSRIFADLTAPARRRALRRLIVWACDEAERDHLTPVR